MLKDYLPFATSLCGAFFGALGAYWVGRYKQKRDENDRRHAALLATQYAFVSQWHVVEDIRRSLLEPHRKDPMRHFCVCVYIHPNVDLTVPFKDLTFIIDSDETNLLQEIHLAKRAYLSVMRLLERHNKLREDFENRFPFVDADPNTGIAKIVVPPHEFYRLKNSTDTLYETVDLTLPKFDEQIKKIHKFVKRNFKKKKAITGITPKELIPDTKS